VHGTGKRFVYILRSDQNPEHPYVGTTSDVENRLDWHNHGPCGHTVNHRPWSLVVVIECRTDRGLIRTAMSLPDPLAPPDERERGTPEGKWQRAR
jgi:predicted GIY-YIG superfamily endonuclease